MKAAKLLLPVAALLPATALSPATAAAKAPKSPSTMPFVDDAKAPDAKPAGAAPKKSAAAGVPLLPGSGSKEPVNITADKLDFLNKENKLIYTGSVVVVQGDSTLKASRLDIDLQRDGAGGATAPATPADAGAPGQARVLESHVERSEGPKLEEAEVVVSGGRGLGSADGYRLIDELADFATRDERL